jgi:hypothetical protein
MRLAFFHLSSIILILPQKPFLLMELLGIDNDSLFVKLAILDPADSKIDRLELFLELLIFFALIDVGCHKLGGAAELA